VTETQRYHAGVPDSGGSEAASIGITVRQATPEDEAALTELERETWLPHASPAVYRPRSFFEASRPDEVRVAILGGRIVGYVVVRSSTQLPTNAHVLAVVGLGVSSTAVRRGVAGRLLNAVEEYAFASKVERLTLRVLAVNEPARALYEKHGYRIEGVLRGEFRLPVGRGGTVVPVDDVLMAKTLGTT
jgi:ribosomal protein S18 acetylase RimI-like enzyme